MTESRSAKYAEQQRVRDELARMGEEYQRLYLCIRALEILVIQAYSSIPQEIFSKFHLRLGRIKIFLKSPELKRKLAEHLKAMDALQNRLSIPSVIKGWWSTLKTTKINVTYEELITVFPQLKEIIDSLLDQLSTSESSPYSSFLSDNGVHQLNILIRTRILFKLKEINRYHRGLDKEKQHIQG